MCRYVGMYLCELTKSYRLIRALYHWTLAYDKCLYGRLDNLLALRQSWANSWLFKNS